jgi:hypothetical protein
MDEVRLLIEARLTPNASERELGHTLHHVVMPSWLSAADATSMRADDNASG